MRVVLDEGAYMPEKAHKEDAGYDLRTPKRVVLHAHSSVSIDTGVHIELPLGYAGMLKSKSGLNVKHDIQCEGVVDCGYTGPIVCKLYNHGDQMHVFEAGDKITQMVIVPVLSPELEKVSSLDQTDRGDGGFGSTGR